MTCRELEQFLYPYLDGEFASDERLELERHLAECPGCARKVHQESRFRETLRIKAREAIQSPALLAPPSLRDGVLSGLRREQRRASTLTWMRLSAAAMVVVVAGGIYVRFKPPTRQRFLDDATRWYQKRLPHESQPSTHEQAEAWFGDKLEHRVVAPRFRGARVEGVRILNVQDRPAAYIGYQAVKGSGGVPSRVGLFVFDDRNRDVDVEASPSVESNRGYHVAMWRDGEIVYELVTDLDETDIHHLIDQMHDHAGPSGAAPPAEPQLAAPAPSRPLDVQTVGFQKAQ